MTSARAGTYRAAPRSAVWPDTSYATVGRPTRSTDPPAPAPAGAPTLTEKEHDP